MSFGLLSYLYRGFTLLMKETKFLYSGFCLTRYLAWMPISLKEKYDFCLNLILFDYLKKRTFLLGNSLPERSIPVYLGAIIASFL